MNFFQNALLPFTISAVIVYGLIKKQPVFSVFIKGASSALKQTADLLPALTVLSVMVSMMNSSGLMTLLSSFISPLTDLLGIPEEVLPLCMISPFSGSGGLSQLQSILSEFPPDSYVGRTASVIAGASETTFYTVAVYFSAVGITKTGHTIPSALTADIVSYIAAAFFCRLFP